MKKLPSTLSAPLYHQISEKIFTQQVITMARMFGYLAFHARPAMKKGGRWVTPMIGDVGFPDLVLISKTGKPAIMAELKADKGRVTPEQQNWLECAKACGIRAFLWRPRDIESIEKILRG